jgi:hypothetical protein
VPRLTHKPEANGRDDTLKLDTAEPRFAVNVFSRKLEKMTASDCSPVWRPCSPGMIENVNLKDSEHSALFQTEWKRAG